MAKKSYVGIENGYYGTYSIDKDGNKIFCKAGKAIKLRKIQRNLDTNNFILTLSYKYLGTIYKAEISREVLYDWALASTLVAKGADISKKTFDIAVDSIRMQEDDFIKKGKQLINVYEKLGWTTVDTIEGIIPCFRSHTLIGYSGAYIGDYKIEPMGEFDEWKQMIEQDVLGDVLFELVVVAALSSVIVPIVSPTNDPGNPILHLYGISGCGKSTALELAASVAGEPFDGDKIEIDINALPKARHSIYGSWGGTINALVGSCSGNKGYPILLNELGKCQAKDLSTLIYDISEGSDKLRFTSNMKIQQSEGYATSFLSTGEHSLLDRCKDKSDGLRSRVLEVEMSKTPNGAERADRIKAICKEHNGHAISLLAEYILKSSSFQEIQKIYNKNYKNCKKFWTKSPSYERFVSKFVAIYLTTVDIVEKALGIKFNKEAIMNYLHEHDKQNGSLRNSSLNSYDVLLQDFQINRSKFIDGNSIPKTECWGKVVKEDKTLPDDKHLVERFLVFRETVKSLLNKHGYTNPNTCYKEWKNSGLIDTDNDRNTRSRKIFPSSDKKEDVFVFNVFENNQSNGGDNEC